jgi:hypothetical protein
MDHRLKAAALVVALASVLALPAAAGADALPDGRVYEQVSPVTKNGFDAGAPNGTPKYQLATADGNGLLYGTRGPMGTVHRGLQEYAVGRRGADGWSSESALPAGSSDRIFVSSFTPHYLLPSSDLSSILFTAVGSYVPDNPVTLSSSTAIYKGHADGTVDWLTRPIVANPNPAPGSILSITYMQPIGASPDLSTVYLWSLPTLLAQDAARDTSGLNGWGLYEYTNGVLEPAGTLPDGTEDPGGAAPAGTSGTDRGTFNFASPQTAAGQVSRDGSTLLFVSPDPGPVPGGPLPQLYVRRGGHSTLVSHDASHVEAPTGVAGVGTWNANPDSNPHEFAYGSADGKSVIFQSLDPLAVGAPNDGSQKVYRYDVDTDTVTYLDGVSGTVVAASDDGRRFLFGDTLHIALWDNGTVKTIASVGGQRLSPATATASGSVFVFSSDAAMPGFNNGGVVQVYRYDVALGATTCVSCPPAGVVPSGPANLSNQDTGSRRPDGEVVASRGMSDDASRVFFDTPDPLRPRDTNGRRDVYEWTPSGVSLISSGRSQDDSFFLDNSASGDDVFFATAEGLDVADTDGGYDAYDARVGGGFKKVDQAAPCLSDACQGGVLRPAAVPGPGSRRSAGPGDQETPAVLPVSSAKLRLDSRRLVKGVVEVSVTIARAGRVRVSGSGLGSVVKHYAKPGAFTVKVALSAAAKRSLKAGQRLKLSVRVGFTPSSGPASSVTFVLNAKA